MDVTSGPGLIAAQDADLLTLTLDRPGNANALSPDLVEALIETLAAARDVRLCVLRGEGKHFCAGFDLSDLEDLSDGDLLWRFLRIETLLQAGQITASISLLVIGATVYSRMVSIMGLPNALANTVSSAELSFIVLILIYILIVIALGTLIDAISIILIMIPIFLPLASAFPAADPIFAGRHQQRTGRGQA